MAEKPSYEELEKRIQELEAAEEQQVTRDNAQERLFNLSLDMLCVADLEGYFRVVNSAFEKTLGHSRQPYQHTDEDEHQYVENRIDEIVPVH